MNPYNDFDPAALTQIRDHAKLIHDATKKNVQSIEALRQNRDLLNNMNMLRHFCDMILENQD